MENITPRVDIAFKKIFGVEEKKDLLISLINSIVAEEDRVEDLLVLNPYSSQNFLKDKLSILDIKAQGTNGKLFNVELQITDEDDYNRRALYYWAKLYNSQLQSGAIYSTLCKTIGIHILNFASVPDSTKYHNIFYITEQENSKRYFNDLELHTIELKKFTNNIEDGGTDLLARIKTSLDAWVAFLTRHNFSDKENLPELETKSCIKKALNVLEVMNFTETERSNYDDHVKWMMTQASTIQKYHQEGIERGIKQTALQMLKKNIDLEFIAEVTSLSLHELQQLKYQN